MAAKVDVLSLPAELNVVASYPAGVLTGAAEPALAEAFLARLTGAEGQSVLREAGFGPAPALAATGK
jgi:ABC-type molybdate transport system substrate-binding protein